MKKIDSTEKLSRLVVKSQRWRSQSSEPKRDPEASSSFACYLCKKPGHTKKNYMKYTEILKKRGNKDFDRDSNSGKSDQVSVVEEADENPYDVLTAESRKKKYSDVWLLDSGYTHYMCPIREWFSTYKPYDEGSCPDR